MFEGAQERSGLRDLRVSINFLKKCLPVIIWNKKNSSKQVVTITQIFFAVATFKGLGVVSFQRE